MTSTTPGAVALDGLAALVAQYDQMIAEAEKWAKAAEVLKKRIQAEMGDATEATVGGQPVFTWRPTGQFAEKRFTTEQPELAARYTRTVERDVLDRDLLAAEHPEVFTAYRARRFERKA